MQRNKGTGRRRANKPAGYQPWLEALEERTLLSIFGPPAFVSAGHSPGAVAVGYFNADGNADLAVANTGDNTVGIYLGNGDGTFAAPITLATPDPVALAVGDFNNDNKSDLAVVNGGPNGRVSILFGNGDATFAAAGSYAVGVDPAGLAITAPFYPPGQYLLVANAGDNTVSVLQNNRDGTFTPKASLPTGSQPVAVAVGDLNLDGQQDIAVANAGDNTVGIYLSNGDGTFAAPLTLAVGARPVALTVTDDKFYGYPLDATAYAITILPGWNPPSPLFPQGPPHPRLLVANAGDGTVSVVGHDSGSFAVEQTITVGGQPSALVVDNFTGDYVPDLAVADQAGNRVAVCPANSDRITFGPPVYFTAGAGPVALVATYLNGDYAADLVTADQAGDRLAVLLNTAVTKTTLHADVDRALAGQPVTFTVTVSTPPGGEIPEGTVMLGDGWSMLTTMPLTGGSVTFTSSLTPGEHVIRAYFPPTAFDYSSVSEPVTVDVDSDTTFSWPGTLTDGVYPDGDAVALGDFNGDGNLDAAVANEFVPAGISILLGRGDGTFTVATIIVPIGHFTDLVAGDFNHDGRLDLAVMSSYPSEVDVLLGNGDGTFAPSATLPTGPGLAFYYVKAMVAADFNGDGNLDLGVANNGDAQVTIFLGTGTGAFLPPTAFFVGATVSALAVGDFNGDGIPDVALLNSWYATVEVSLGRGDGTFAPPVEVTGPHSANAIAVADFNRDGKSDLFVVGDNSTTLFLSRSDGTFTAATTFAVGSGTHALAVGDFNGDGNPDIAVSNPVAGTVDVFLGDGAGGLAPARQYVLALGYRFPANPAALAAGDFNGDGALDLMAIGQYPQTLSVLLNHATAPPPAHVLVAGADAGGGPNVVVRDASTGVVKFNFLAYDPRFTGGVRVAVGDVNGDGIPDIITAPGAGGGPDIHVYDGVTGQMLGRFWAFDPAFTGGCYVAAGDVNGDSFADIIVGAGEGGGPNVAVFDASEPDRVSVRSSFFAFDPNFTGGVRVAAGDMYGDRFADIIAGAGPGGGPSVAIYSVGAGTAQWLRGFFALDPAFTGGVYVAAGDNGQIAVGAGAGGGPQVSLFNGADGALLRTFLAYDPAFTGGVRVGAVNVGSGMNELLTAPGPGGGPDVRRFRAADAQPLDQFFALDPLFTGGVFVGGSNAASSAN